MLAVLAGFFVAGQVHTQAGAALADTTWSAPIDTIPSPPADADPAHPADTTWSAPVDGGTEGDPVPVTPNDTTWGW
ncbi:MULTISPECIES: hypothetical protein [unclassified Streptomyces]|uniref:hypothetical protein n=1 Tax=unclassified Streptomyces TaxID=2593676 RepID=UPI002DDAD311|nr:hypothetical protein [Streptomyces sp. NBC_01022]WRZ82687.1 hypothetical protein OG316_21690 [Streptomyces sp. NBC_01022]